MIRRILSAATADSFIMTSYKASPEFHEWLHKLADRLGLPVTSTIDVALRQLGDRSGLEPPPARTPPRRRPRKRVHQTA